MVLCICNTCLVEKEEILFCRKRGKYTSQCKDCKRIKEAIWRNQNKDKISLKNQKHWLQYKETDIYKEVNERKCRKYRQTHKELFRFYTSERRCLQINATPSWVDMEQIKQIYLKCPAGYEVDHIIPLNHSLVCGLHTPDNLQYLLIKENRSKSNKFNIV